MVKEISEEFLEEVVNFSWKLYCDRSKSSYPKFKSYKEMYNVFLASIHHKDDKVLVCYENEEIIGTLNLLVKKYDNYIQSNGGIFTENNFYYITTQFIDYLRVNYSGYEMYFGYSLENKEAIRFFTSAKAELVDSSLTMKLKKDDFVRRLYCNDVVLLESELYDEYSVFHDKHNPNIYWNSKRIFDNLDLWKIYIVIIKQKIVGSIFIRVNNKNAEVFGISINKEYEHQGLELKLLSQSLEYILERGIEEILYFVEEDRVDELEATLQVGFKKIDNYRCYKLKI